MNWDLTSYFPTFDGPEMQAFKQELQRHMAALQKEAAALAPLRQDNAVEWEDIFLQHEDILARLSHLASYVGCLSAADARNEGYAREEAALALVEAENDKLGVELLRALKEVDEAVLERFVQRPALSGCAHFIDRLRREAQWSMSPAKEILAADLGVDGIHAWGRLYETISGKLEFDMEFPDGRGERLPISQRRSLMQDPDRQVRRAAFEGGNAAWRGVEDVAGAALNAIAGTRLALDRHRGVEHFLDTALFQAGIARTTLEAMFAAIFQNAELARRILRLKARALGAQGIAWYDLEAPLPLPDQEKLSWEQGKALVEMAFRQAYPRLGDFLHHMYEKEWIEWEPRPGKRPGAFCSGSLLNREARIYMTYNEVIGDVRTLAHEAGHAFHSFVMRDLRPCAHLYPMTLAESASTFGEMILTAGLLADPGINAAQKARILDMETGHGAIYLLDIPVRFEFERALYEERPQAELTTSRFGELMAAAQRRVFGEVLEEGGEDPHFWASKMHFYFTGVMFYNFPYTFGFLLSRGLFAMFKQEGAEFLPRYEEFLRLTGSDTPENIARHTIGRDLQSPEFWSEAIMSLEDSLIHLEQLLPEVLPQPGRD